MRNVSLRRARLMTWLTACVFAYSVQAQEAKRISIPAGDLQTALEALGQQSGAELVYQTSELKGLRTKGVSGNLTAKEAAEKLVAGTPLTVRTDAAGAMLIGLPHPANSGASDASNAGVSKSSSLDGSNKEEGTEDPSGRFRVAQGDVGPTERTSPVTAQAASASGKNADRLEEIVVTGSRIARSADESVQEVKIYSRQQIERSGQTSVASFLSTVPDVSVSPLAGNFANFAGQSTVQLHGLPVGTTLILLNGRRVGSSAVTGLFFNIDTIPASFVERIEIVPTGSSAVYGSDAIAGVVNIVTRRNVDGVELSATGSHAQGYDEQTYRGGVGKQWDDSSMLLAASYERHSSLLGADRTITADNDYSRFASLGGRDTRITFCNPGNVTSTTSANLPGLSSRTSVIPAAAGPNLTTADFISGEGQTSRCSLGALNVYLPSVERSGALLSWKHDFRLAVTLHADIPVSHLRSDSVSFPRVFVSSVVPATNAFNPFQTSVRVAENMPLSGGSILETDFVRPEVGISGAIGTWNWDLDAWDAYERDRVFQYHSQNRTALLGALASSDPQTALNVFAPNSNSESVLDGAFPLVQDRYRAYTAGGEFTIRGAPIGLPAGRVDAVVGAAYSVDSFDSAINANIPPGTSSNLLQDAISARRHVVSTFAEVRAPLWSSIGNAAAQGVLLTAAYRRDQYSDFGGKTTPQFGLEWRPVRRLLFRSSYSEAFRAPQLVDSHAPQTTVMSVVTDPFRNNEQVAAPTVIGGNPHLHPETGKAFSVGSTWAQASGRGLQLSVAYWHLSEANRIDSTTAQLIVSNPQLFPGQVVRGPSTGTLPGPITSINAGFSNFGSLRVSGLDAGAKYAFPTQLGDFTANADLVITTNYLTALTPGAPLVDRLNRPSTFDFWAPRYRGTAGLAWAHSFLDAWIGGHYVGRYLDYQDAGPNSNHLGNFWMFDATVEARIGAMLSATPDKIFVRVSAVNIFNRLPDFSNYNFDTAGYDPTQYDLKGRFLSLTLGTRW
jgi:iron complex outermembrane recepter protein